MNQVLQILKQRHHSGSQPGKRDDNYKVALCVEGGGMRGIVSGGSLAAFEALGYLPAFDVIYGASSGAYASSYFVVGNALDGCRFFFDFAQKRFISLKRVLRGSSLFDLDYVQTYMHKNGRLNYQMFLKAKPTLHIVTTEADRHQPLALKYFKNSYDVDQALKSSATFPTFKHLRPRLFKRHRFLDAAFVDPYCLHSAIKEGCTHIVVLFSMPVKTPHEPSFAEKAVGKLYLSKISPNLAEIFLHHSQYSVNGLSHIWNHYDGTHILTLSPPKNSKLPGQLTRKRKKLGRGFLVGARMVLDHFAPDKQASDLIVKNFKQELRI